MKRTLSLQKRLMLSYSFFTTVLLLSLCLSFYLYNARLFRSNSEKSLTQVVAKSSQQLDYIVSGMDRLSVSVISDEDFISALTDLSTNRAAESQDNRTLRTALAYKVKAIYKDSVYRVSVFNERGDFFTSILYDDDRIAARIGSQEWLSDARNLSGNKLLLPPHADPWVLSGGNRVFSMTRMVRNPGNEVGFIEVQQNYSQLEDACRIDTPDALKILIVNDQGDLIYSNHPVAPALVRQYLDITLEPQDGRMAYTGNQDLLCYNHSDYTGWTVMALQSRKDLVGSLAALRNITILIGLCIIMTTLAIFYYFARHLTTPLRQLQKTMETVNMENLPDKAPVSSDSDEIQSLNHAFQTMRTRLNQAIETELHSRALHSRAQYDALQAQINPHFIYNMLGVLANMGEEADQEAIADVSRSLARMLRYSTASSQTQATVRDETEHLQHYLSLMKCRFEHRLTYTVDIDARLSRVHLPRLTLQPLAENAVTHGFNHAGGMMILSVTGIKHDHHWEIRVEDNGSGFDEESLARLRENMHSCRTTFRAHTDNLQLSIGGMGLISSFSRLFLLYGDDLVFDIFNLPAGGACIRLQGPVIPDESEAPTHVQSDDR